MYIDPAVFVTLGDVLRDILPIPPGLVNVYAFSLQSSPLLPTTPTSIFLLHSFTTLHVRLRVQGGAARTVRPEDASKTLLRQYALTIYNEKYISTHPDILEDVTWIEEDDFSNWLSRSKHSPRRSRPRSPECIEISDSDSPEPSSSRHRRPSRPVLSTPKPMRKAGNPPGHQKKTPAPSRRIQSLSEKTSPLPSIREPRSAPPAKRRRPNEAEPISPSIIIIDSDSDDDIKPVIKGEEIEAEPQPGSDKRRMDPRKKGKSKGRGGGGKGKMKEELDLGDSESWVSLTRQSRVKKFVLLDDAPEVWDVPRNLEGSHGYLLDFRSCQERLEWNGKAHTIDAYIKRQCQDAWDGPTGSFSGHNAATVLAFEDDPVVCRVSKLKCKGAVRCSFSNPNLLKDHTRYEPNYEDTKELIILPTQEMNARAGRLPSTTLEFYRLVMSLPCPYEDEFGPCEGTPVMKKKSKGRSGTSSTPQRDAKEYFIGCSHWTTRARSEEQDGKMSHTYHHIRREAREDLLIRLFNQDLDASDSSLFEPLEESCGIMLHPAHKFQGGKCVYPHSEAGELKDGILQAHSCTARLTIYVPEDGLRAIVIPHTGQPHSHPAFPRAKITFAAEEQYRELVRSSATPRPTVLAVEKDLSPSKLPHVIHPGLNNKRKKRDLIYNERQRAFPNGLGIGAAMQLFEAERNLPLHDRYIFVASTTSDNAFILVTLNPELAQYLHITEFIQVDTTFKRVYGDYNEWKVVVWLCRLNRRMCVGRVYTDRSTEVTYIEVWKSFFVAVQTATGRALGFKAFHGSGGALVGIIVDEEGAQGNALGPALEHLLSLHPPTTEIGKALRRSGGELILYVIVTCIMHYNRNIEVFAKKLPSTDFQYLRSLPYLKTQAEVDRFGDFCIQSDLKELKDWWTHKKSYPWLLPSIIGSLSKIPPEDRRLIPDNTNAIEGDHSVTNKYTGTRLSLIDAIQRARELDACIAATARATIDSGIYPNSLNTAYHRSRANMARTARQIEKATAKAKKRASPKKTKARPPVLKSRQPSPQDSDGAPATRTTPRVGLALERNMESPPSLTGTDDPCFTTSIAECVEVGNVPLDLDGAWDMVEEREDHEIGQAGEGTTEVGQCSQHDYPLASVDPSFPSPAHHRLPQLTPTTTSSAAISKARTTSSAGTVGSFSFVEMLCGYTELDEELDQLAPLVRARVAAGLPPYPVS